MAAIDSFTLPAGSDLPPGAGRLVGNAAPYAITAPSPRWIAATPAQMAQQNPDSDRWIARPDVDAHVTVLLEPLDAETTAEALSRQIPERLRTQWPTATFGPDEPLVGSADIQSLGDLGNAYEVVRGMRFAPITRDAVVQLAVITLLPVAPLLLTMISWEELLKRLLEVLL